jgi:radical SAM superfamily enzyme YgiQ (UPF0313 family)
MSMLKANGHEIDLIFDPGLDDNLFLKAPHLAWLNRHEALLERAKNFKPDLIAMGVLTNLWPFARKMAEKLKESIGVPILVGGHHAQALPEYVLSNPHVDYGCTGEGEIAILELCQPHAARRRHDLHPDASGRSGTASSHRNEMGPLENEPGPFPFPKSSSGTSTAASRTT